MPSTYSKRIWSDPARSLSVYVNVVDSTPRNWHIVHDRVPVASFLSLDAARQFAERFNAAEHAADTNDDDSFREAAANLKQGVPWEGELSARLLAAIYAQRVNAKDQNFYLTLGRLAARAGPIPRTESEFLVWFDAALKEVQARSTREIRSRAALRGRLDGFRRVLKVALEYDVEFRSWHKAIQSAIGRIPRVKRQGLAPLEAMESWKPFTRAEVESLVAACDSLAQLALSICYLSHGFRAGEAERLTPKALAGGSLVLSRIVTKTKTSRTPAASLALRTCLPLLEAGTALPQGVERKRFRPTAAVALLLAGVPMLEVMERLGHGSLAMLTNHYAKVTPDDYAGSTSLSGYLSCGKLTVDGHAVEENTWDLFCLRLMLKRSSELGALHVVKENLRRHLTTSTEQSVLLDAF